MVPIRSPVQNRLFGSNRSIRTELAPFLPSMKHQTTQPSHNPSIMQPSICDGEPTRSIYVSGFVLLLLFLGFFGYSNRGCQIWAHQSLYEKLLSSSLTTNRVLSITFSCIEFTRSSMSRIGVSSIHRRWKPFRSLSEAYQKTNNHLSTPRCR
ncbi:hypothetical protein ACOSQ3_023348 [Xanthoceras sorbifolium]